MSKFDEISTRKKLDKPPYKSDGNTWLTRTLFVEMARLFPDVTSYEPVFSLNDDIPGYINCRKTFVSLKDPTGYKWAMKYLQSWEHFEKLLQAEWFVEAYQGWLKELKIKLKSEAIERISKIAQEASPQALPANKYLATHDWEKAASDRGRPSKAELKGELKKQVKLLEQEQDDAKRIGLRAN